MLLFRVMLNNARARISGPLQPIGSGLPLSANRRERTREGPSSHDGSHEAVWRKCLGLILRSQALNGPLAFPRIISQNASQKRGPADRPRRLVRELFVEVLFELSHKQTDFKQKGPHETSLARQGVLRFAV